MLCHSCLHYLQHLFVLKNLEYASETIWYTASSVGLSLCDSLETYKLLFMSYIFQNIVQLVHSLSLTSVASFSLILQSTCPFRFLSLAFNISRAPCLDIFSSLRNCFRFCSSFNSYFLPLSEKKALPDPGLAFGSISLGPRLVSLQAFLSAEFEHSFLSLQLDAAHSPSVPVSKRQAAQSNRWMRTRTYCSQLTNQSFHSYLCHQQTRAYPTVLGVRTRCFLSLAHCPSVYTILAARGVRLHFYSCWWSKKVLWWNLWQN